LLRSRSTLTIPRSSTTPRTSSASAIRSVRSRCSKGPQNAARTTKVAEQRRLGFHPIPFHGELSDDEVQALEARLDRDPGDVVVRRILAQRYFLPSLHGDETAQAKRHGHVLWLIANAPAAAECSHLWTLVNPHLDASTWERARDLWEEHVSVRPDDLRILGNAAEFFLHADPERAAALFERAAELDPRSPARARQLAEHRMHLVRRAPSGDPSLAREALRGFEHALSTSRPDAGSHLLIEMAQAAFAAEDWEAADSCAWKLLDKGSWLHGERRLAGQEVFEGNTILGRLALREGDVERAKRHLLSAGRTAGSPALGSFGPTMVLAKELLERGERDVVLEYLDRCAAFWTSGREALQKWAADVRAGSMPDFGPFHLRP
jgi:hypothetical protein